MSLSALFNMLGPDESLPWLEDDENVCPDDKPLPTEGGLFDEIPTPRDPLAQLSSDEE